MQEVRKSKAPGLPRSQVSAPLFGPFASPNRRGVATSIDRQTAALAPIDARSRTVERWTRQHDGNQRTICGSMFCAPLQLR